ncbi:MAG: LacI family transcriptional regulator [Gemmatimonadetes bacterium]|nr:LacI family transcriptional regulator [Gemmatimonadota bacterium]
MIMSFCEVTEHLIRLGHERIGFIGTDWNTDFVGSAKGKGYLLAMKKHGLAPQLIPGRTYPARAIYDLVKRLGDQFTALVCRSDYTAIGVCRGLREVGIRVPEDVAVVGYGNLEVAAFVTPPLTTLATPYEEIAERAMELMLEQLEGQDTPRPPRQITLQTSLIVRKSCGGRR